MKDSVIYVRSSVTNCSASINLQLSRCAALAASRGEAIDAIYADTATGAEETADELERLLVDCAAARIATIYVASRDRISRDAAVLKRFEEIAREYGVEVVFLEDALGMSAETI